MTRPLKETPLKPPGVSLSGTRPADGTRRKPGPLDPENDYTGLPTVEEAREQAEQTRERYKDARLVRCRVHRMRRVAVDQAGHLLGRCSDCLAEAAEGLGFFRRGDYYSEGV